MNDECRLMNAYRRRRCREAPADPARARPQRRKPGAGLTGLVAIAGLSLTSCEDIPRGSTERNNLAEMRVVPIAITGRATYQCYVADTARRQQLGLMNVTEEELPADHGMFFVFDDDRPRSFWMRNTIIPLDIAYIRFDGMIMKTYTMCPLVESGYHSVYAVRCVLEVRGGEFARQGIIAGDKVEIPADLLNP